MVNKRCGNKTQNESSESLQLSELSHCAEYIYVVVQKEVLAKGKSIHVILIKCLKMDVVQFLFSNWM